MMVDPRVEILIDALEGFCRRAGGRIVKNVKGSYGVVRCVLPRPVEGDVLVRVLKVHGSYVHEVRGWIEGGENAFLFWDIGKQVIFEADVDGESISLPTESGYWSKFLPNKRIHEVGIEFIGSAARIFID